MSPARAGGCLLIGLLSGACAGRHAVSRPVEIRGFVFQPDTVHASVGDTIVWTNRDLVPHTATAEGAGDTGPIGQDGDGRWVVTKAGVQPYVCRFHPNMRGVIVVD